MFKEEEARLPDYELLDSGQGYRLEKFGEYLLSRPDPAVLWEKTLPESEWKKADASFIKSGEERGAWKNSGVPDRWMMTYGSDAEKISFYAKLTPFKHTGVFPEQVANWNFISSRIKSAVKNNSKEKPKVLSLFGYTGIHSVLSAKLGAKVTHLDASKPAIGWAKENMLASGLPEDSIRWILDDALKFVKREAKRGAKYDCIIMDPPAFGRGSKGEVWKFNEDFPQLMQECQKLIDPDDFNFMIVNAYAVSLPSLLLKNIFDDFSVAVKISKPKIDYGELILRQKSPPANGNERLLSTGIFGRLYQ